MKKREQYIFEFNDYLDYQMSYLYLNEYDLVDNIKYNLYYQLRDRLRNELRTQLWMHIKSSRVL